MGQKLKEEFGEKLISIIDNNNLEKIKEYTVKIMIDEIKKDLSDLGVFMDSFVSDSLYKDGKVQEVIDHLNKLGLIYKGTEKPKGSEDPGGEREQDLFKSTMFGDDIDRPIKKLMVVGPILLKILHITMTKLRTMMK